MIFNENPLIFKIRLISTFRFNLDFDGLLFFSKEILCVKNNPISRDLTLKNLINIVKWMEPSRMPNCRVFGGGGVTFLVVTLLLWVVSDYGRRRTVSKRKHITSFNLTWQPFILWLLINLQKLSFCASSILFYLWYFKMLIRIRVICVWW